MTAGPALAALALLTVPGIAAGQALPASPASSTEKPGDAKTAPKTDDSGLILTASTRARYETVDGRPNPTAATSEDAFLLRTGIAVEYGPGPLAIGAEVIDSRAYGLVPKTLLSNSDVNAVELTQAYLKLTLAHLPGTGGKGTIEGGRFLINLGSGRLVATDEYSNTVNSFTGVRTDLQPDRAATLTLFYVLPQQKLPSALADVRRNVVAFDAETFRRVLIGGYLRRERVLGASQIELTFLRLAEHDAPGLATLDRRLVTVDWRFSRDPKPGQIDHDVEGAYQFGSASVSTDATARHGQVSAGFFHAAAGYTLKAAIEPRVGLFYDYASGNGRDATLHRFDTLYGSRRSDLGPSGTYAALGRENLSAPGIQVTAKPVHRAEVLADYRAIWLASRYDRFYGVTDATGRSGRFGGQQVEGRLRYWLIPEHLRLENNFAILFKGAFLRDAPMALARDQSTVRFVEVNLQATF